MQNTLTRAEWAVMSALWKKPNQTISGIIEAMDENMDWKYNTYATYIKRMVEKGLVGYTQLGRDKFYFAAVDKSACILAESRSVLDKIDTRATKEFVMCMIKGGGLNAADREELRHLLDELNREEGDS
jgi:BlaI family penicillinase repressor